MQELIAPQIVHFFDKNWRPIGNKKSLRKELSAITGIETIVFIDPSQMDTYSIATRMSWASDRTTTRTEDIAYSLLGIFKVNMPLLYGEGSEAFIRLQEEIVKKNHDESIFAWGLFEETSLTHDLNLMWDLSGENIVVPQGPSSLDNSLSSPKIILPCGMFAVSPQAFSTCRSTRGFLRQEPVNSSKGATLTNRGLEIQLPVIEILNDSYGRLLCIGLLNCAFERSTDFVGILFLLHDGICNRSQRDLYATFPVSPAIAMSADPQDLIISNEFSEKPVPSIHISYAYVIFKINTKFSYQIASIHPARNKDIQWDDKNQVLGFRLHVKDTICFRFSEVFHKTMEFYLAIQTEDSGECLFYLSPKAEPRFDIILGSNRQLGSEHKLTLTDPGSGELVRVGLDVQSKTVLHRQMYRLTLSITGIATETKTPNQ